MKNDTSRNYRYARNTKPRFARHRGSVRRDAISVTQISQRNFNPAPAYFYEITRIVEREHSRFGEEKKKKDLLFNGNTDKALFFLTN